MPMGQWAISHMSYRTVFYMAAFRHQERLQCAFSSLVNLSFASRRGKQKNGQSVADLARNFPQEWMSVTQRPSSSFLVPLTSSGARGLTDEAACTRSLTG